jgi:hydrogenase maturation protein HypF
MEQTRTVEMGMGRTIRIRGLVQGVGFRPALWRLAQDCGLIGEVWNDAGGVTVEAWGEPEKIDAFIMRLASEAPPLARIESIEASPLDRVPHTSSFRIAPSRGGTARTGIAPDAASCPECLAETFDPSDRRSAYPFSNCTHCGPRLTIVESIPYDRINTSMAEFEMCPACRAEYENPADRRFHAQPTACPVCGPRAWIERLGAPESRPMAANEPIAFAARLLREGAIFAIKGLGGFHLACSARNEHTVRRLRACKRRYAKPFALMARDIGVIERYCAVSEREKALLASPSAPVVILPVTGPEQLSSAVAPGQSALGFMLPYTPLHHLLLRDCDEPLVMTSGNRSDEPQCIDNAEARRRLSPIAEFGLFHDRRIINRVDDSVARIASGEPRILRRARGYAPAPIRLPEGFESAPPLLALGGQLKNTFCLVKDGQAILSQHIGDLEDAAAFEDYRKALRLYSTLFDHEPEIVAIDMHPEYLSTKFGREWAANTGRRIVETQHHHAHIAACLAENGVPLDSPPVLGVALDGLGFGSDGGLWGGEFLLADYACFERLGAFPAIAMPGGARAARQPWRNAFAHLDAAVGWEHCKSRFGGLALFQFLQEKPVHTLRAMIRNRINSPLASSCGRLFDAVAGTMGVCLEDTSYEGQAACELESLVDERALRETEGYPVAINAASPLPAFDFGPMWRAILSDLTGQKPAGVMAARFHKGLAQAIAGMTRLLFQREGHRLAPIAALSGGSFQNRVLFELVERELKAQGLKVLSHRQIPANDGGLSLGQAAVAAASLSKARAKDGVVEPCA